MRHNKKLSLISTNQTFKDPVDTDIVHGERD